MRRTTIASIAAGLAFGLFVMVAAAAAYTLEGEAEVVSPGHASDHSLEMHSGAATAGSADFDVPAGTTFGTLDVLSSDYLILEGNCVGGSPRFAIEVPETGPADADPAHDYIFVYFEPRTPPAPPAPPCPIGTWTNTGDLLAAGLTVDTSQLGGTFYHDYADAVADYGSLSALRVLLVTDGGWAGAQTVRFDNVNIDGDVTTFEEADEEPEFTKESCKKGGWVEFTEAPGPFKNQGQCVSHFARMQR